MLDERVMEFTIENYTFVNAVCILIWAFTAWNVFKITPSLSQKRIKRCRIWALCANYPSHWRASPKEDAQTMDQLHFSKIPITGRMWTRQPVIGPNSRPGLKIPCLHFGHNRGSVSVCRICFNHSIKFSCWIIGSCMGNPNKRRACCSFLRQVPWCKPKCRMRTNRLGSTCARKRPINSIAGRVICFSCPFNLFPSRDRKSVV